MARNKAGVSRDIGFDTWHQTGVFRETVNDVTVGYFVGWRYRYGGRARNIREGLYFKPPESATEWRDNMENNRKPLWREHTQIA
jgi:hypothetical protein